VQFRDRNFHFMTMRKVHAVIVKCRHGCCSLHQSSSVFENVSRILRNRVMKIAFSPAFRKKTVVNRLAKVAHFSRLHSVKYLSRHRGMLVGCTLARLTRSSPEQRKLCLEGVVKVKIGERGRRWFFISGRYILAKLTVISLTLLLQQKQNSGAHHCAKNDYLLHYVGHLCLSPRKWLFRRFTK